MTHHLVTIKFHVRFGFFLQARKCHLINIHELPCSTFHSVPTKIYQNHFNLSKSGYFLMLVAFYFITFIELDSNKIRNNVCEFYSKNWQLTYAGGFLVLIASSCLLHFHKWFFVKIRFLRASKVLACRNFKQECVRDRVSNIKIMRAFTGNACL